MKNKNLIFILIAIALGSALGASITPESILFSLCNLLGELFMNSLKLVIVPLVVSSIITGVAKMAEEDGVAKLGFKTFGWFIVGTSLAALTGLAMVLLIQPGIRHVDLNQAVNSGMAAFSVGSKLSEITLKLFPPNIFQAAAEGQMLGLIVFSFFFGYFIPKIKPEFGKPVFTFWKGTFEVMMNITRLFMKFLPVGVFALIAKVVAESGLEGIKSSGWFFATMMAGFALYTLGVLSFFLITVARVNPLSHIQAMAPALLTAFSTSSSAATLPIAIECLEDRAKIPNRIVGFSMPVGTSFHMAGTALFECVAVIFIAQYFGMHLGVGDYLLITLLSILLSAGVAGIPSGCVASAIVILTMLGLPLEGVALLMVVERFVDMVRTVVNVYSNSVCTRLIAGK